MVLAECSGCRARKWAVYVVFGALFNIILPILGLFQSGFPI